MNGFKLLAIRPLPGCDKKYLKNLKEGMLYKFYKDYKFYFKNDQEKDTELTQINFDLFKNKPISKIDPPKNEVDLYSHSDLKINISAVVGKNGSGKSALFELFFGLIYILAENKNILVEDGIQHLKRELEDLHRLKNELFPEKIDSSEERTLEKSNEEIINEVQNILDTKQATEYKFIHIKRLFVPDPVHIDPRERIAYLDKRLKSLEKFLTELKAEVLFELNGDYYTLTTSYNRDGKQIGIYDIAGNGWCSENKLSTFFYSIAINYSIHGLNALHIGEWINPLFHKNDAYQTPLVINPMRINGDIDVNNEEYLAKSRLLSNILIKSGEDYNLYLTEKQEAYRFTFRLIDNKTDIVYERETGATANPRRPVSFEEFYKECVYPSKNSKNRLFQKIYEILFDLKLDENQVEEQYLDVEHHESVKKYILKKLVKIARKKGYGYEDYFSGNFGDTPKGKLKKTDLFSLEKRIGNERQQELSKFEEYLTKIKSDNSHITLKLKQAINYLKNNPLKNANSSSKNEEKGWKTVHDEFDSSKKYKEYVISAKELSDQLNNLLTSKSDSLINYLPPSLFYLNIEMKNSDTKNFSNFNQLSSGEQQHIHSLHSVYYHLNNLYSVFHKHRDIERQTYPNINIMLDEIELYFHPDFQRKFIADLLSGIKRLNICRKDETGNPIGIHSINILFSTHSPFILSDIPASNILRLENGLPSTKKQEETFGANIHQLLHNDFFLENGFVGEFGRMKINETIQYLTYHINKKENINREDIKVPEYMILKMEALEAENKYIENECKIDLSIQRRKHHSQIINLIGEEVIKLKLLEMYNLAFDEQNA